MPVGDYTFDELGPVAMDHGEGVVRRGWSCCAEHGQAKHERLQGVLLVHLDTLVAVMWLSVVDETVCSDASLGIEDRIQ
jgi:hypothetical protein